MYIRSCFLPWSVWYWCTFIFSLAISWKMYVMKWECLNEFFYIRCYSCPPSWHVYSLHLFCPEWQLYIAVNISNLSIPGITTLSHIKTTLLVPTIHFVLKIRFYIISLIRRSLWPILSLLSQLLLLLTCSLFIFYLFNSSILGM